jgi:hypothetical protein
MKDRIYRVGVRSGPGQPFQVLQRRTKDHGARITVHRVSSGSSGTLTQRSAYRAAGDEWPCLPGPAVRSASLLEQREFEPPVSSD